MDCRDFRQDMWPYLKDELDDNRIAKLLDHVEHCAECKNELKIHFFVSEGINRLENSSNGYNLINDFEKKLDSSRIRCRRLKYDNWIVTGGSLVLIIFVLMILVSSLFI